jgi:hypothetical protein
MGRLELGNLHSVASNHSSHLFPDHLAMVGAEIDKIFDDVSAESDKSFTTVA